MALAQQLPFSNRRNGSPATVAANYLGTSLVSFGLDHTTMGPDFDVKGLLGSHRCTVLQHRARYYGCTQHNHKQHDWYGRVTPASQTIAGIQPLIGSKDVPGQYVTLDQRRPCAPYRLGRVIVNSFTNMLFGHGRWPAILSTDPATQDFAEALVKAGKLKVKMARARNLGGSGGTVGVSWRFAAGLPRFRVHKGECIFVKLWEDEDDSTPAHVIELKLVARDVRAASGKVERKQFWRRRDWTTVADVVFDEVEFKTNSNPSWQVNAESSTIHGDGFCHFVWVRNLPNDEEDSPDGQPDYAEVYDQMNQVDVLNSVVVKGAVKNLDPTLVLRMMEELVAGSIIRKGSENALNVGESGNASYLELAGTAIAAGTALIDKQRMQVLETAQCVVADPDEVAAQGTSSVALKMMFAPMIAQTDILRYQYGDEGICRLLNQMIVHCRNRMEDPEAETPEQRYVHEEVEIEPGVVVEEPVKYELALPPRIEKQQVLNAEGQPTGEERAIPYERHPGKGVVELEWGDYFKPTSDDRQKVVGSLTSATGGQAVLSQRTAVSLAANVMDKDPAQEWAAITDERDKRTEGMFPEMGGRVGNETELPGGALPAGNPLPAGQPMVEPGSLKIDPETLEEIITVNEARASQALPVLLLADGRPDPDGYLKLAEFKARRAAEKRAAMQAAAPPVAPTPV